MTDKIKNMRKFLVYLVVVFLIAWALQSFTAFKVLDYGRDLWQKIDWAAAKVWLKEFKLPSLNFSTAPLPDPEKKLNIFIRDGKFLPNLSVVSAGAKVVWYNEDTKVHTVTGEGWGSSEIPVDQVFVKTFDTAGRYAYQCSLHPSEQGEIIVK